MFYRKSVKRLAQVLAIGLVLIILTGVVGFIAFGIWTGSWGSIGQLFLSHDERQQQHYLEMLEPIMSQSKTLDNDVNKVCDEWKGGILSYNQLQQNLYLLKAKAEEQRKLLNSIYVPDTLAGLHESLTTGFESRIRFFSNFIEWADHALDWVVAFDMYLNGHSEYLSIAAAYRNIADSSAAEANRDWWKYSYEIGNATQTFIEFEAYELITTPPLISIGFSN